jgi:hypothetical protein
LTEVKPSRNSIRRPLTHGAVSRQTVSRIRSYLFSCSYFKVKVFPELAMQPRKGSSRASFLNSVLDGDEWSTPAPDRCTHGNKRWLPPYRRLSGPPGRNWTGGQMITSLCPDRRSNPKSFHRSESLYRLSYVAPISIYAPKVYTFSLICR